MLLLSFAEFALQFPRAAQRADSSGHFGDRLYAGGTVQRSAPWLCYQLNNTKRLSERIHHQKEQRGATVLQAVLHEYSQFETSQYVTLQTST